MYEIEISLIRNFHQNNGQTNHSNEWFVYLICELNYKWLNQVNVKLNMFSQNRFLSLIKFDMKILKVAEQVQPQGNDVIHNCKSRLMLTEY